MILYHSVSFEHPHGLHLFISETFLREIDVAFWTTMNVVYFWNFYKGNRCWFWTTMNLSQQLCCPNILLSAGGRKFELENGLIWREQVQISVKPQLKHFVLDFFHPVVHSRLMCTLIFCSKMAVENSGALLHKNYRK